MDLLHQNVHNPLVDVVVVREPAVSQVYLMKALDLQLDCATTYVIRDLETVETAVGYVSNLEALVASRACLSVVD